MNRIEDSLNMIIGLFFCLPYQINNFIFNQALLDEKIFPNVENKRRFLVKIIKLISEEAKQKNLPFEEKKFLNVCESIKKFQEIRNILAHKFIYFPEDNIAGYMFRKSFNKIQEEKRQGKKVDSFERKEIKLDDEIEKANQILEDSQKMLVDFLNQVIPIVGYYI